MEKHITGNEPYNCNPHSFVDKGITIYQEAFLRFMLDAKKQWSNPKDAAKVAKMWADEYIDAINK